MKSIHANAFAFGFRNLSLIALAWLSMVLSSASVSAESQDQQAPMQSENSNNKGPGAELFSGTAELESSVQTKGAASGIAKAGNKNPKRRGEFAFAPIPLLNPSIGNGMGGVVMYNLRLDSERSTPPSTFGIGGFGTGNGSWSLGAGARLYLKGDLYRVLGGYGGGVFNYNFFGIGSKAGAEGLAIPLSQHSKAYLIQPTRRVFGRWYIGPRYHHISNQVKLNEDKLQRPVSSGSVHLPVPLPDHLNLTTAALGLSVQRDSTDSPFYPRSGSVLSLTIDFFDRAFGAQLSYQNFTVEYNKYISLGAKNVLASHVSACAATNGAPFFDVCLLGSSKDLRGYQMGQYRDNRMLDGQVEFRRELFWRLGAVAFVGLGEVAKTFGDFNGSDLVPGGGIGLRYDLAKRYHVNLRADYAWGDNSRAFYMSVGEAF